MRLRPRRGTQMLLAAALCLMLFAGTALCQVVDQAGPADANTLVNRHLRILYAGRPGSDWERDFVGFLKKYFNVVQTGNLQTFKEADAQGFDVTLLDWDTKDFKGPWPQVSQSFSRPLMTLGVPGADICSRWRLKTSYL